MAKTAGVCPMYKFSINIFVIIACAGVLMACSDDNKPDVSDIKVEIRIERFDQYLFEKLDTSGLPGSLQTMEAAFPSFTRDFLTHVLGLPGFSGNVPDSVTEVSVRELKRFIRISRPLYDSIAPTFAKTGRLEADLTEAFRHVKYYFPGYQVPEVVTFVGPLDAPAIAVTPQALAIGLQLFAGKDFSFYTSMQGQELYPRYLSRRFEPGYIPVNAMKAVAEDIYRDTSAGSPLIEQMIEKGKQWYMVDLFVPDASDTLKTGYTGEQLEWAIENEGVIWTSFLQGNDIYTTEPAFTKTYLGEAPYTEGMPESSPGNIGQWIGWRIIQAYVARHPATTLPELLRTDAKSIFAEANYRPK